MVDISTSIRDRQIRYRQVNPGHPHFEATVCRGLHQVQENGVVLFLSDGITNGVGQEENELQEDIVQLLNIISVMFASSDSTSCGSVSLTWEIQTPRLFTKGAKSLVFHALEDDPKGSVTGFKFIGGIGGSSGSSTILPISPGLAQIRTGGQR